MRSPVVPLRAGLVAVAVAAVLAPAAAGAPIPPGPPTSLPLSSGGPAVPKAIPATKPPQNPFLARNPFSNIHDDTWMTDAYATAGPVGRGTEVTSGAMPPALCGSLAFDKRGRIVSVCPSIVAAPQARIIDPETLAIVATYDLPNAPTPPGTKEFQNFAGGGYFYLDAKDRIWSATKTNHLVVLSESSDGTKLVKTADYDLNPAVTSGERVTSALPDFQGRIWFVSKQSGRIGVLDPKTKRIRVLRLGEEVENSFAVDRDAVYIVSDKRMYRFSAGKDGKPRIDWKVTYANSGIVKPSQVDAGSGTTPTVMAGGYVAITDNADPMNIVVYRKARKLGTGVRRVVCQVPVFSKGASATENSLLTAGRALIVENNYGYQDPFGPTTGALTEPGFARVDVDADGKGCTKRWTNTTERAPSVVPKLSTRTGLVYSYTRDDDPNGTQPWFWTAIDATTGKTAFKRYAGSGLAFNNNYAGLALGADGSAYLGTTSGIQRLRDGG
ncbi:MAG: hypothetical protein QOH43_3894 [Solirubrobacteraceae bacterium]|jgi:hypothetical protein|nr:hypothetical protein [Solirubrobacteraceae bacterium]